MATGIGFLNQEAQADNKNCSVKREIPVGKQKMFCEKEDISRREKLEDEAEITVYIKDAM
ncbi:MAG: hypothetical protein LUE29_03035 [Lachnospiraceae bacterium]|nr:hypothetical protein [Lachnospiraceae bacterium]